MICMDSNEEITQAEKVLFSFYNLAKRSKEKKFALEDVAVKVWKDCPAEFCMRGYIDHPDVKRIERIISNLTSRGYLVGTVHGYALTQKGITFAQTLNPANVDMDIKITSSAEASRKLQMEINRIIQSKIFKEYVKAQNSSDNLEFLESDFFEFLGTSPRSLNSDKERKTLFKPKYEFMVNELVPFCKKNSKTDNNAASISKLWDALFQNFSHLIR